MSSYLFWNNYDDEVEIKIKGKIVSYNENDKLYCIKLQNAKFIGDEFDDNGRSIIIEVDSNVLITHSLQDIEDIDELLDEIESKNDQQHIPINPSMPKTLSHTLSKWKILQNSNHEKCNNAIDIKHCPSINRIYFILHYYQLWILNKTRKSKQFEMNEMMDTNTMCSIQSMSDFLNELQTYSIIDIINDFHHIYDTHTCDDHDHLNLIQNYFNELNDGQCDEKYCKIYQRHCKQQQDEIDNIDKMKECMFYIESSMNRENLINEINLQTKLDMIHSSLFHDIQSLIINTDKFITHIIENDNDDDDIKDAVDDTIKISRYPFGECITYWNKKDSRYCSAKYDNLELELLSNKIYSISQDTFDLIECAANNFLQSNKGILLIAQRTQKYDEFMKKCKIKHGSQITLNHIIAMMVYCNIKSLQNNFKTICFRTSTNIMTKKRLKLYHQEMCHLSRLLFEVVHCFGISMDKNRKYYHAINCKLLLNRLNTFFEAPTSLTLSQNIAFESCPKSGIVIELIHGGIGDISSMCFNLSSLSNNPFQHEILICHSFISCNDIIINQKQYKIWLKIFRFWLKIKEGFFYSHLIRNGNMKRNDQLSICAMISNLIINHFNNFNHCKYDKRIPNYMQLLFNHSIKKKSFIWSSQCEQNALIQQLRDYLDTKSKFVQYLIDKKQCILRKIVAFGWNINEAKLKQLLCDKNDCIHSTQYKIFINQQQKKQCILLHFECKANNGLFKIKIYFDKYPKYIQEINVGIGLFIEELKFDTYSYGKITSKKNYNSSLHSLFKISILQKFKSINLKFQIQIFNLFDVNTKSLPIDIV